MRYSPCSANVAANVVSKHRSNASFVVAASFAAATSYTLASSPAQAEAPPPTPPSDTVSPYHIPMETAAGKLPREIILYQYEVCPFCCKVKAFLDYHKIPYRCVEVNPLTKGELKWSNYKKVPVILMDNIQINDSSAIISRLAAELEVQSQKKSRFARAAALLGNKESREEEEQWRRWVDERLVKIITVNIYRNAKEAFQTFDYITENGNFNVVTREAARIVGATLMWGIAGRLKRKYNVEGDERQALYDAAHEWVNALGDRTFMGGRDPNIADLAVFGVLRSVVGTDTFMDVMHATNIGGWYERMMAKVGNSSRIQ